MATADKAPTDAQIPAPSGSFADVMQAVMLTLGPAGAQRQRLASEMRALALGQWAHRRFGPQTPLEEWLALVSLIVQAVRSSRSSPPPEEGCS